MEKYERIPCSLIHIECSNEVDKEFRILGENYWSFDFYVLQGDVVDLMYQILVIISEYNFKEYSVGVGDEEVYINPKELWSLESISLCLNSNFGMNNKLALKPY